MPLTRLSLAKTSITDAGCHALSALGGTLTSLDLTFNPKIRAAAFFASLPNLTELDASLNAWLDDEAAITIASSMPKLRKLTLEKTDVCDAGLAAIATHLAGSLEHLDLSRTPVSGSEESFAGLSRMRSLRNLLLAYSLVDLQLAFNLPPNLDHLKLSRAIGFGDDALQCLARQPRAHALSCLDLGSPAITDAALPALQSLADQGLTSLTLWHTKLTREGAERLMAGTGLELDTSMASSDGTYLLRKAGVAPLLDVSET